MNRIVVLILVASLTVPATADVLGNAYDGTTTSGSIAQDFGPYMPDTYDIWVVSDFETTVDYYLCDVVSQGWTTHLQGADGEGANFDIYDGLPWDGGSIVLNATDVYEALGSAGTMGADFGGQMLPVGSYYVVFQAVRDFLMTGGNSVVYHTTLGDNDDYQWNPGEQHGFLWRPITTPDDQPIDVNWQLTATPVPKPASLMLVALGGLLMRRR